MRRRCGASQSASRWDYRSGLGSLRPSDTCRSRAGSTAGSARRYAWPAYRTAPSVRARSAIHQAAATHATATANSPHSSGVSRSSSPRAAAAMVVNVRATATRALAMANRPSRMLSDGAVRTRHAITAGGTQTVLVQRCRSPPATTTRVPERRSERGRAVLLGLGEWVGPVDMCWPSERHAVYDRCMSSTRTQVYLTDEQRERVDRVAASEGLTMAQVIRRALDEYLDDLPDPDSALDATFGAAPDAAAPSRDSWARG